MSSRDIMGENESRTMYKETVWFHVYSTVLYLDNWIIKSN